MEDEGAQREGQGVGAPDLDGAVFHEDTQAPGLAGVGGADEGAGEGVEEVDGDGAAVALAAEDAGLLTAISDPKWMIQGLRNRDLVAALYAAEAKDDTERRRRSTHVTHLLRLLRAHGLLDKIPGTHRYQVSAEARIKIQALIAARNANPDELTNKAA